MYTNWPFTAKTNTHTIHMSEFCQRSFSTETDVSIKSANDKTICSRYDKVKSPGRENLQLPNTSTDRKKKNKKKKKRTEPKLKCFSN